MSSSDLLESLKVRILVTGTDPTSRRGGIGFSLPGFLRAVDCAQLAWISIPTYHPATPGGKWRPWLAAFPKLWRKINEAKKRSELVLIYSHAGAGFSLFREFFILCFCRLLGAATILHLHAYDVDLYLQQSLKRFLFEVAIFPATCIAVLTPWWLRRLEDANLGKPLFVIPNPLPSEWQQRAIMPRSRKNEDGKIILLSLTRLVPGKGVDLVIEAMPLLPESFELIVAGEGSERKNLEKRVCELGIENRVHFSGWVSGDAKQKLMDNSDIFVQPSRYDSFGLGFIEAMANGLPVVAAKWGPIADVVADGRCGVLIEDASQDVLADAILHFVDPDVRYAVGSAAKQWVVEQFSAEKVGERIRRMIESVV